MDNLAVLIMSCDKNQWLLKVFFESFVKNGGCKFDNVYLSMEKLNFDHKDLHIIVFNNYEKKEWCHRLKNALQKIKQEIVLLMLDDFIVEEPIEFEKLNRYISYMKDGGLSNIILTPVRNELNDKDSSYKELYHRNRYGRYKTSLQCGLWNKQVLLELIEEKENAWEFEIFGNLRSFLYSNKFYAVKSEQQKPIWYNDGFFMVQGKINLDEKKRLEKKLGICIENYSVEEVYENKLVRDDIRVIPRIQRRLKIIYLYLFFRIKSYFIKNK